MTAAGDQTMVTAFGTSVRRIRTPNPQDVLSGRGGGINSHEGNKVFRQWVNERKSDYNLAQNKKEKIDVAMQIVRKVQSQVPVPGRFLQKDPSMASGTSGQWWVEVDEAKALAKTTQALREGAPKIRQAHQNANGNQSVIKKRKRKASVNSSKVAVKIETPAMDDATEKMVLQSVKQDAASLPRYKSEQLLLPTTDYSLVLEKLQENVEKAKHEADAEYKKEQERASPKLPIAPLTSNKVFREIYGRPQQANATGKGQFNPLSMPAIDPFADTPPLMAAPEPEIENDIPVLSLDTSTGSRTVVSPPQSKRTKLHRVHSLSLSEYEGTNLYPASDEAVEFVNPFADESNILGGGNSSNQSVSSNEKSRLSCRSINGYLNRLLSFSSSSGVAPDENSSGPQFVLSDANTESWSNSSDYFFHDDTSVNEGTKTTPNLVLPRSPEHRSKEKTSVQSTAASGSSFASLPSIPWIGSASTLIRRASLSSSRSLGLDSTGKQ